MLERVRRELETGANRRSDGRHRLPTVGSLDEARAESFEQGLTRRTRAGLALTEADRLTRAVRIMQLRREGVPDHEIRVRLHLAAQTELEADLNLYRVRTDGHAHPKRDVKLDREILDRLRSGSRDRRQLAGELGISYSALASRITRLRRDGHEIPDGRRTVREPVNG